MKDELKCIHGLLPTEPCEDCTMGRPASALKKEFIPPPGSMWLVVCECRYNVIHVCVSGKGFYIPGQEPCWGFDHVDEWIEMIEPELPASRQLCPTHPDVNYKTAWGCPDCVKELREDVRRLRDAGEEALRQCDESHADPCPVCGVHPEQCGCWIGMMRLAIGLSISKPKPTEPKP